MSDFAAHLQNLISSELEESGVPSASLCVFRDGESFEASAGSLNLNTGVQSTTDAIYQIGSISKPFTATLAMQHVEKGLIDLDAPVSTYLPDFRLKNAPDAGQQILIRQILCHTCGIDGDHVSDTSENEDCIEKLVDVCSDVDQLHPPGQFFSYSNLAYNVLGRILEVQSQKSWFNLMREDLISPLGLEHFALSPYEALRFRTAYGHWKDPRSGTYKLADSILKPRSNGPSGTRLTMSARDLMTFGRLHLDGGTTRNGQQVLPSDLVREMQVRQVEVPHNSRCEGWGLGWMQFDWSGKKVIGHDGGVDGACAFLRIFPEDNVIIALMANAGQAVSLFYNVIGTLADELCGAVMPKPRQAVADKDLELSPYVGRYHRYGQTVDLTLGDGVLVARSFGEHTDPDAPANTIVLNNKIEASLQLPGEATPLDAHFLEFQEDGRPDYFHTTFRAFRRIGMPS